MTNSINYLHKAPEYWIPLLILGIVAFIMNWKRIIIFCSVTLVVLLIFFRGWLGKPDRDPNSIICPCDGKVLRIVEHPDYIQIAIFLNVHNIHIQYLPCDGIVKSVIHKPGEFHPAYLFEKSAFNERTETVLGTRFGDVKLVQIAGLVARRIVSMLEPGANVYKGDSFGLIKLGSRVDIWLPKNKVQIHVTTDQRVKIGERIATIL